MTERKPFGGLYDEIHELFDELWQMPRLATSRAGFRPRVDVFRAADPPELTVVVELAGVDPEHVHVFAEERALVISGERHRPPVKARYHHLEIDYGPFQRRFLLPEDVDTAAARAEYRRGLLSITLPVVERPPEPRGRVAIEVGRR
jgi:HSP20 family protein